MAGEQELWRPSVSYPMYEVSNFGHVRNRHSGLVLTPQVIPTVRLVKYTGGIGQPVKLSHLVAETWLGEKPSPATLVRHLDDNSMNNAATNLAYGTWLDNAADAKRNGRNSRARQVKCIHGHEFSSTNTIITKGGRRQCRICKNNRRRGGNCCSAS